MRMTRREDDGSEGTPVEHDTRSASESANRKVWAHVGEVARFASAQGWIDRSERVLLERITKEYVGGDVLDVGVGGGRTVPLLRRSAASYVGIDFVPELVTAASKRFPDADIRIGDARHLDFPDASFDLAVFSINGIDAISHSDEGSPCARSAASSGRVVLSSSRPTTAKGPAPASDHGACLRSPCTNRVRRLERCFAE